MDAEFMNSHELTIIIVVGGIPAMFARTAGGSSLLANVKIIGTLALGIIYPLVAISI